MTQTATTWTMAPHGLDATAVLVRADVDPDAPAGLRIRGLGTSFQPDPTLLEARDRVRAAFASQDIAAPWRDASVTVSLDWDGRHLTGAHYDLAIAAAILAADGGRAGDSTRLWIGGLGLDGKVRGVWGLLPMLNAGRQAGFTDAVIPAGATARGEAHLANMPVVQAQSLRDADPVSGRTRPPVERFVTPIHYPVTGPAQWGTLPGDQEWLDTHRQAAWAGLVAAAGGFHVIAATETAHDVRMLARWMRWLQDTVVLPTCDRLDVQCARSLQGASLDELFDPRVPLIELPPGATVASTIGGRRSGAVALANHGLLVIPEGGALPGALWEGLYPAVTRGKITVTQGNETTTWPARAQLVIGTRPPMPGRPDTIPGWMCARAIHLDATRPDADTRLPEGDLQHKVAIARLRPSTQTDDADWVNVGREDELADQAGSLQDRVAATITRLRGCGELFARDRADAAMLASDRATRPDPLLDVGLPRGLGGAGIRL